MVTLFFALHTLFRWYYIGMYTVTSNKCNILPVPFTVRTIRFEGGERMPIMICNDSGQPLLAPTIYSTTMLRGRCVASKTIEHHLRAIMFLYTWAAINHIDIEQRMKDGTFLSIIEIEGLVRVSRLHFKELLTENVAEASSQRVQNVISIDQRRNKPQDRAIQRVDTMTAAVRIGYIRDYLDWLSAHRLSYLSSPQRTDFASAREQMLKQLSARKPAKGHGSGRQREGLSEEEQNILIAAIEPGAVNNPFIDKGVQHREQLLVWILLSLGIRRGEALGITIDRINLRNNEIDIIRNADDPTDPRTYEPNTKTLDRRLSLNGTLAAMINRYITEFRNKVPGARKHKFLFVAHDKGTPLSISAFDKTFNTIKKKVPGLPGNFSAHLLRHTWNDRFSDFIDENKIAEGEEIKQRSYNMGWSETSGTAATYTRRSTRKRANKLSLGLQKAMFLKKEDDQ